MAITRIRGGQIHDRTIDGIKIQQGALINEHLASNAAIHESKLDINWESHTEILQNKKVVDYVQVNNTLVGGVSSIDATALSIIPGTDPGVTSDSSTDEGIIIDDPKNIVPIRDSVTGDPVLDEHGHEVYGRITKDDVDNKFIVSFYTSEPGASSGIDETPFVMEAEQKIDWQYARRFNLLTVNEMFASNKKFVEGAADATAHLNIEQLAKDLYGPVFTLDRDGNANLPTSITQQIIDEIARAKQAETNLQTNIDGEAAARIAADNSIISDLSSLEPNKGASLVGFNNATFTAKNVESALIELGDRINGVEGGGSETGSEVIDARSSTAKSTDGGVTPKVFATLDDRLEEIELDAIKDAKSLDDYKIANDARIADIESKDTEQDGKITDLETEVQAARGTDASINDRLEKIETSVSEETAARELADTTLQDNIDAVASDLAAEVLRSTTAETDLDTRLTEVETEISDTYNRDTETTNGYFVVQTFTSLAERFKNIEEITDAGLKQASESNDEIIAARGTAASLDERLDVALNEDGTLKAGKQIHTHKKTVLQINSPANTIDMPVGQTFVNDGTLNVYINGILQANGINFTEVLDVDGKGTAIDFGAEQVVAGDVVVIEWVTYNEQ